MSLPQRVVALLVLALWLVPAHAAELRGIDDPGVQLRIRDLIDRTCIPATQPATRPIDDPPWSSPDNGLIARIDCIDWDLSRSRALIVVRLKNVSDHPLVVPADELEDQWHALFTLHRQFGEGPWERVSPMRISFFGQRTPTAMLQPRQSALALLELYSSEVARATRIKLTFSPRLDRPGEWTGTVETPPHPVLPRREWSPVPAPLSLPDHRPSLDPRRPGIRKTNITFYGVAGSNEMLAKIVPLYDPRWLSNESERRANDPEDELISLYAIALAAARGNRAAALRLLEKSRTIEMQSVCDLTQAIRVVLDNAPGDPPEWALAMASVMLADRRNTVYALGGVTETTVSAYAQQAGLVSAVGAARYRPALPGLMQIVASGDMMAQPFPSNSAIKALVQIGDAKAASAILEFLQRDGLLCVEAQDGVSVDKTATWALGELKAREAVPHLLGWLEDPYVIGALGRIGDPRALPRLRELVRNKGVIIREDLRIAERLEAARYLYARVAVMRLENVDPIPYLCQSLADPKFPEAFWRAAAEQLGVSRDPRGIPAIVRFIKHDPFTPCALELVEALPEFKDKAAVDGLIECVAVVDGRGRGGFSERDYAHAVTISLHRITRRPINSTAADWRAWWKEAREGFTIK